MPAQPLQWNSVTLCGSQARYLTSQTFGSTANVHMDWRGGHTNICNSLQRLSMQQRVCVHYGGTTDAAQPVPPSPGMDRDPSATLESSTVLLSQEQPQELVDKDTSRVTCAAPRDSVKQGVHLSPEEVLRRIQLSVSYL